MSHEPKPTDRTFARVVEDERERERQAELQLRSRAGCGCGCISTVLKMVAFVGMVWVAVKILQAMGAV